jgi:hypothetical protein
MVVPSSTKHNSVVLWNALNLVCPFPSNLNSRLGSFGARTRREDSVISEKLVHQCSKLRINIVVERAGRQGQPRRLLNEGSDKLGMAVAVVESRRGSVEVKIVTAFRIPDRSSLGVRKYNRQ